jgi:hypothetical protein
MACSIASPDSHLEMARTSRRSPERSSSPTIISIPRQPGKPSSKGWTSLRNNSMALGTSLGSTAVSKTLIINRSLRSSYVPRPSVEHTYQLWVQIQPSVRPVIVRRYQLAQAGIALDDPNAVVIDIDHVV